MTPLQIVLLVLGILALQLALWVPLRLWFKGARARRLSALQAELSATGERVLLGPETALYRGASSGSGYPRSRGNSVVALTDRRLIVRPLVGASIEVPAVEIAGGRAHTRFAGAWVGGRPQVIVRTRTNAEIGLLVENSDAWVTALQAGRSPAN